MAAQKQVVEAHSSEQNWALSHAQQPSQLDGKQELIAFINHIPSISEFSIQITEKCMPKIPETSSQFFGQTNPEPQVSSASTARLPEADELEVAAPSLPA